MPAALNYPGSGAQAMAMTFVEQSWSDGSFDDDPKLSVSVYDRSEFPGLQLDNCVLTLPGNVQKEMEPEARADRERSALTPQGFQPDQVHVILSNDDIPSGNPLSFFFDVAKIKAGNALIVVGSPDVGIPAGGMDRIRRRAEVVAEVVEHSGSQLPTKLKRSPIVHQVRHVTNMWAYYLHVPSDIWDQAGKRVLWLLSP